MYRLARTEDTSRPDLGCKSVLTLHDDEERRRNDLGHSESCLIRYIETILCIIINLIVSPLSSLSIINIIIFILSFFVEILHFFQVISANETVFIR